MFFSFKIKSVQCLPAVMQPASLETTTSSESTSERHTDVLLLSDEDVETTHGCCPEASQTLPPAETRTQI